MFVCTYLHVNSHNIATYFWYLITESECGKALLQ